MESAPVKRVLLVLSRQKVARPLLGQEHRKQGGEEPPDLASRAHRTGHRRNRENTRIRMNRDPEDNVVVTQEVL